MWQCVLCGLDSEDETINFGTRAIVCSDSDVFESHTLATVKRADEESSCVQPKIFGEFFCNVGLVVVIDQTLIIYEESFEKPIITWSGGEDITSFSVDPSGEFLLVALENLCLCCVHISSGIAVFERTLPSDDENVTEKILKIVHEDSSIVVFISSGQIFRFHNIDYCSFKNICIEKEGAEDLLDAISETIKVESLFTFEKNLQAKTKLQVYSTAQLEDKVILANEAIYLLNAQSQEKITLLDHFPLGEFKLKKIEPINQLEIMLALTEEHRLLMFCQITWTVLYECVLCDVVDFTMVEDLDENDICVLVATKKPELLFLTIPDLNIKWNLNVEDVNYNVIKNTIVLEEGVVYIEIPNGQQSQVENGFNGFQATQKDSKNNGNSVNQVFIKAMVKSRPEDRLERMLRRGKFDAAYKFAVDFGLNVEIIHKARIQKVMSDLQTITFSRKEYDMDHVRSLFESLMNSLNGIQDVEFVIVCCVNTLPPEFSMLRTLLLYAKKKLALLNVAKTSPGCQQTIIQLKNLLTRLNTYQMIQTHGNVEAWLKFSQSNLLHEVIEFLKKVVIRPNSLQSQDFFGVHLTCDLPIHKTIKGDIHIAITIWLRHRVLISEALFREKPKLLDMIPDEVGPELLIKLLKVIMAEFLECSPNHLKYLVVWTTERTRSLERTSGKNWCEDILQFCESILKIIEDNLQSSTGISNTLACAPHSPIQDLLNLIKVFEELTILKNNYNIRMSFSQYSQPDMLEVMFDILDTAECSQIPNLLNGFLKSFMFDYKLCNDTALSEYIKLIIDTSVNWWHRENAAWEDKVSVLIPFIVNVEERLQCILCVLRRATVPWSSRIDQLAESALNANHKLVTSIQNEFTLMPGKIILKKYNFQQELPPKLMLSKLIRFIFAQNRDTMLEDAVQLVSSLDSSKNYDPYMFYLHNLIQNGHSDEAMKFLDSECLSSDIVQACCNAVITRTSLLVKADDPRSQHYVNIVDAVNSRLNNINNAKTKKFLNPLGGISTQHVRMVKNVYNIQKSFNTKVSVAQMSFPSEVQDVMKTILREMCADLSADNIADVVLKAQQLATYCDIPYEETIMQIIKFISHNLHGNLTKYLIDSHNIQNENIAYKLLETTSFLLCNYNPRKHPQLKDSLLPYVCQLSQIMLTYIQPSYLIKGTELHQWVQLFKKQHLENSISEVTIHSFIMSLLDFYRFYLYTGGCDTSLSMYENSAHSQLEQMRINVITSLDKIKTEQPHDLVNLKVLIIFSLAIGTVMPSHELFPDLPELMRLIIRRLLKKVVSARTLDSKLGVALLSNFTPEDALAWIHEAEARYMNDPLPLLNVSCLGMEYSAAQNLVSSYMHFQNINMKCVWGNRITEFGIPYKDAFKDSIDGQKQLLQRLASEPNMKVSMLRDFCLDIHVNTNECLLYFLQQTLLSWKPQFEVQTDAYGNKKVVILNDIEQVRAICEEIFSLIKEKKQLDELVTRLIGIIDKLNYYSYEIFFLIINLIESAASKVSSQLKVSVYQMTSVLVFFSSYIRVSKPQEVERNMWASCHQDSENLPEIANYRLPYGCFVSRDYKLNEFWKILKPEINMSTYSMLYHIVDFMGLDKNSCCGLAINQIANDETIISPSKDEWSLNICYSSLLDSIKDCVNRITKPDMVTAALFFVVNRLPPGADQVAAVKLCYERASDWYSSEKSEESKNRLIKVEKKYLSVLTTHALYSAGLGKPEYLQLVLKPKQLISVLYNDKSVLLFHKSSRERLPDINAVAHTIAKLHAIPIVEMRRELLGEWLSSKNVLLDSSLTDVTTVLTPVSLNPCEDDNFLRACYMLQNDNESCTFLLSRAFPETDSQPTSVRLRALQCLCAIKSYEDLVQMTGMSDINYYLEALHFVMELENLGFSYSMEGFLSWDKVDLIKFLVSQSNTYCTRLAFKLILYFKLKEASLIDQILKQMVAYKMVEELVVIMPKIADICHHLTENQISDIWNFVVESMLAKCHQNMDNFNNELEKIIQTIISCPQLDYLNIDVIKSHLCRLNSVHEMDRILMNVEQYEEDESPESNGNGSMQNVHMI